MICGAFFRNNNMLFLLETSESAKKTDKNEKMQLLSETEQYGA